MEKSYSQERKRLLRESALRSSNAESGRIPLRDNCNIENYVNDPRVTPEEKLITETLFPTA